MKRRGFFTALAGAAAGTAAAVPVKAEVDKFDTGIDYLDFNISWTGWKPSAQFLEMVGQWVARPKDGKPIVSTEYKWGADGIVSSFPGGVGYFNCGMHFDTCFREGQRDLVGHGAWFENPDTLLKAQRHSLEALKKFIRENC